MCTYQMSVSIHVHNLLFVMCATVFFYVCEYNVILSCTYNHMASCHSERDIMYVIQNALARIRVGVPKTQTQEPRLHTEQWKQQCRLTVIDELKVD
jgi:hypothetical protein